MRRGVLVAAILAVAAGSAGAQTYYRKMNPSEIKKTTLERLFAGINVTDSVRTRAGNLVDKYLAERAKQPDAAPGSAQPADELTEKLLVDLRGLLTTSADRAQFTANVKRLYADRFVLPPPS